MKRVKLLSGILSAALLFSSIQFPAGASENNISEKLGSVCRNIVSYLEMESDTVEEPTVTASGTYGGYLNWELDSNGLLRVSGNGGIISSDQITTYAPWHDYGEQVQKIVIESGITSIGDRAFYDCKNAVDIEIPDTVRSIGKYVFDCSFTSITIPASVTSIDQYAFVYSRGLLTGIWVDEGNQYYSSDANGVLFDKEQTQLLRAPDQLTGEYTVPETVLTIEDWAFYNCEKLTALTISDSVVQVDSAALRGCSGLQTLSIGDGVVNLGLLFASSVGLSSLKVLNLGSGLETMDANGLYFYKLSALEEINISGENTVFCSVDGVMYSRDMTEIISCPPAKTGSFQIPEGITVIGRSAFSHCSLAEIQIPESVVEIREAFGSCSNLTGITIPDGITKIYSSTFSGCSSLRDVQLPAGLEKIEQSAFYNCTSLSEITFPKELTALGRHAFSGCIILSKITFLGGYPRAGIDSTAFTDVTAVCYYPDNILTWNEETKIDYGGTFTWTSYEVNEFEGEEYTYTVPDTNITLAYKVDENSSTAMITLCNPDAIGILEIPEIIDEYQVTAIGDSAFADCIGLTNVVIPETVTEIGEAAFQGCTDLTSVTIPDAVTTIKDYTFSKCGLTSFSFSENLVEIGAYAFEGLKMSSLTLPEISVVGTGAFSSSRLESVNLPNSLSYIPNSMFQKSYYLQDVVFPETLVRIGDYAFDSCFGLNSVVLPEGLISIGNCAFRACGAYDLYQWDFDCDNFTSVVLPSTLQSIGSAAFGYCQSLTEIVIPNRVTRIEGSTFIACYRLENVTISANITYIGDSAFHQCKKLTSVTFRWGAPQMESKAFYLDTTTCYYPGNNEAWTSDMLQDYGGTLTWVAQEMEKPEGVGGGSGGNPGENDGEDSGQTGNIGDPIDIAIDNNTPTSGAGASVTPPENGWTSGSNTFDVTGSVPCVVAVSQDGGGTFTRLEAVENPDGSYSFTAENMTFDTVLAVSLLGDINGDGIVSNLDVTKGKAANIGKTNLDAMQLMSADVNGDGQFSNLDITKLRAVVLGKSELAW